MKKSAKRSSGKKKTMKAATNKPSKPAAKAAPRKPSPPARKTVPVRAAAKSGSGTYTPQPIEGIGWAPFRYPLH